VVIRNFQSAGIYIKAAQFVASLQGGAGDHGIPKEYVRVLQELMDHAPHVPFEEIDSVFVEEFGKGSAELFQEFEEEPLAAASLAQVHKAKTHDGKTVAVKVEYPGLWQMMASDFGVFHTMAGQIKPGCVPRPAPLLFPRSSETCQRPRERGGTNSRVVWPHADE